MDVQTGSVDVIIFFDNVSCRVVSGVGGRHDEPAILTG